MDCLKEWDSLFNLSPSLGQHWNNLAYDMALYPHCPLCGVDFRRLSAQEIYDHLKTEG